MNDARKDKIAVVGVLGDENKTEFKIFRDLINAGFSVDGINPENGEIAGRKVYRNLKELNYLPDLIITVTPPPVTEQIIEECNALGIKRIWMQPGSDSKEAINKTVEYGMFAVYNDCFMARKGIWKNNKNT